MKLRTDKELVIEYAKAYNHLKSSFIKEFLAEDFTYSSQRVYKEIKGKEKYLDYLDPKLDAIKKSNTTVVAQVAIYKSEYCFVLYQISKDQTSKTSTAVVLIKTDIGKILRADMCLVPTIAEVQLLDIIPS